MLKLQTIIQTLEANKELPIVLVDPLTGEESTIDLVDPIDTYADLNSSVDGKDMGTKAIIEELKNLENETFMYVWFDGDRCVINSLKISEKRVEVHCDMP